MKTPPELDATSEETAEVTTADPVGFWLRLATFLIDMAIIAGGSWVIAFSAGRLLGTADPFQFPPVLHRSFLGLVGISSFFYFPWSWRHGGQTVGKRLAGIKVLHTDARPLELRASFIRFLGLLICFVCLGIPLVLIGFDSRKQGLHDKMANTYVIIVPKKKVRVAQPNAHPAIEHA